MKLNHFLLISTILSIAACKQSGEAVQASEVLTAKSSVAAQESKNEQVKKEPLPPINEHEDCSDERSACHDKKVPPKDPVVVTPPPETSTCNLNAILNEASPGPMLTNIDDLLTSPVNFVIVKDSLTGATHKFDTVKNLDTVVTADCKERKIYNISMAGYLRYQLSQKYVDHCPYLSADPKIRFHYYEVQRFIDFAQRRLDQFSTVSIVSEKGTYLLTPNIYKQIILLSSQIGVSPSVCENYPRMLTGWCIISSISQAIDESGVVTSEGRWF